MGPAIRIRISGIRIRIGLATPLAVAVVTGGAASTLDHGGATEAAFAGVAFAAAVAVLILHESARITVYRRLGVSVRGLDVSLAGGRLSLIDRDDTPRREVLAGISGMFVLATLSMCVWLFERSAPSNATHDIARLIAIAVISLSILHAMPALPLDGGRIFRAFVWFLTDDPVKGARPAAIYGHLIALGMLIGGGLLLPAGGSLPYWGFGAIVAGLQLAAGCSASVRDSRWQAIGTGMTIAEAGLPLPGRVGAQASIEVAVDALINERDGATLLVVDESNKAIGVMQLANLRRVRRADWETRQAADVLTPLDALPRLSPDSTLLDALTQLDRAGKQLAYAQLDERHTILVSRDRLLDLVVSRYSTAEERANRGG